MTLRLNKHKSKYFISIKRYNVKTIKFYRIYWKIIQIHKNNCYTYNLYCVKILADAPRRSPRLVEGSSDVDARLAVSFAPPDESGKAGHASRNAKLSVNASVGFARRKSCLLFISFDFIKCGDAVETANGRGRRVACRYGQTTEIEEGGNLTNMATAKRVCAKRVCDRVLSW